MITEDSFHSSIASGAHRLHLPQTGPGPALPERIVRPILFGPFLCELGAPLAISPRKPSAQCCQTMESVSSTTRLARMHIVRNFASTAGAGLQTALFRIQANSRKPAQGQGRIYLEYRGREASPSQQLHTRFGQIPLCGSNNSPRRRSPSTPPVSAEGSCFG